MTVLVTGSSGFTGGHLVKSLVLRGETVYGLDRAQPEGTSGLKRFFPLVADLRSEEEVRAAFARMEGVVEVFHTAALQPAGPGMDPGRYVRANVLGAANLLRCCEEAGIRRMVASSSFSVYGRPERLPVTESHPTKPTNIYGVSKLQAEIIYDLYARERDFRIITLRCDGIFGHGQSLPGFIQYLIRAMGKGEDVELFNQGHQVRDQVYVEDVVRAHLLAREALDRVSHGVFNIGGGAPVEARKVARLIQEKLRSSSEIILSERVNRLLGYDTYMDISKARSVLGYQPETLENNLDAMMREMEGQ